MNPVAESPKKSPGISRVLAPLLLILVLAVAGGAFWLGSKRASQPTPSAEATAVQTGQPTPEGSPTTTPKPTKTPTPTPTATVSVTTKTINSTASLDGWRSSNNGGNKTWYIEIGRNTTLTSRGYVSFDLSSLPSGATITSATLRMYQTEVVGTPYSGNSLIIDHVDYGDSLGSEDYALSPLESAFGTLTSNPNVEWKDLSVTNQVKNDVANGRTRSQFRLRFQVEMTGADAWARFESGDNYVGTGNLPQLVVKYY